MNNNKLFSWLIILAFLVGGVSFSLIALAQWQPGDLPIWTPPPADPPGGWTVGEPIYSSGLANQTIQGVLQVQSGGAYDLIITSLKSGAADKYINLTGGGLRVNNSGVADAGVFGLDINGNVATGQQLGYLVGINNIGNGKALYIYGNAQGVYGESKGQAVHGKITNGDASSVAVYGENGVTGWAGYFLGNTGVQGQLAVMPDGNTAFFNDMVDGDFAATRLCFITGAGVSVDCRNSWNGLGGDTLWQENGINLSPVNINDFVGLGTSTPVDRLHVYNGNVKISSGHLKVVGDANSYITGGLAVEATGLPAGSIFYVNGTSTLLGWTDIGWMSVNPGKVTTLRIIDRDNNENPELRLQYGSVDNQHWGMYVDKANSNALTFWQGANNVIFKTNGNLELAGQIKISGGTPGAGKVLTSDANGLATWTAAGAGNPAGNDGELQFNSNGAFGATSSLKFYPASGEVWLNNRVRTKYVWSSPNYSPAGYQNDGDGYFAHDVYVGNSFDVNNNLTVYPGNETWVKERLRAKYIWASPNYSPAGWNADGDGYFAHNVFVGGSLTTGGLTATGTISLPNNTITSAMIADGSIVSGDIGSATIKGSNIAAGTITGSNISSATSLSIGSFIVSGMSQLGSSGLALVPGQNLLYGNISGSSGGGNLLLLQNNSADKFSVDKDGNTTVGGTLDFGYEQITSGLAGNCGKAACSVGKKVIGGGLNCGGSNITSSYPDSDSSWSGCCSGTGASIYAICGRIYSSGK